MVYKGKGRNATGRKGIQETSGTNSDNVYLEVRLRGRAGGAFGDAKGFGRNFTSTNLACTATMETRLCILGGRGRENLRTSATT